jgi:hypothetical protein
MAGWLDRLIEKGPVEVHELLPSAQGPPIREMTTSATGAGQILAAGGFLD